MSLSCGARPPQPDCSQHAPRLQCLPEERRAEAAPFDDSARLGLEPRRAIADALRAATQRAAADAERKGGRRCSFGQSFASPASELERGGRNDSGLGALDMLANAPLHHLLSPGPL